MRMFLRGHRTPTVHVLLVLALAAGCADGSGPTQNAADDAGGARFGNQASHFNSPTSVSVTIDSASLAPTHTALATASAKDKNGNTLTGLSISWQSSDNSVATVSTSGIVTAVAAGSVSIRAVVSGVTGSASLTVANPVASAAPGVGSISIALDSTTLTVPNSGKATATARDSSGRVINSTLAWTSYNTAVATVSSTGVVTAAGPGSTAIRAMAPDGVHNVANITVLAAPAASVAVVAATLAQSTISVGATTQASAKIYDSNGNLLTGRTIAWSSSNASVVTVNASTGLVTAVTAGNASIVATSEGKTGFAAITVSAQPVATVAVTLAQSSVAIGGTTQATATASDANGNTLTGRVVAWSSSNTAVATVNASTGIVTAVAAGNASIIATSEGKTGTAAITVAAQPVSTVTVTLAQSTVTKGATTQATAKTSDANGNVLTGRVVAWSSSNTVVATVNASTGLVTAVATGTASIVATSEGKTGSATVTVPAVPVATVAVTLAQSSVTSGGTTQATAKTSDASGNVLTGRVVAWSSSNAAVATVNASSGLVTAVAAGTASIVATSEGKSGSATITVSAVSGLGSGSSSKLSGTVASQSGGAVSGGFVEVLSGSSVIRRVAVSNTGAYSVDSLPAGTYGVRLQPGLAYSMGQSEPAQRSVSITTSPTTQNFVVQPAVWSDDFQSYTSSAQITAGCRAAGQVPPAGTFFSGPGHLLY
ncbi:MAG: beta strand repeat-containing protein, partial [Gemmatimonadaceae bacterium]